MLPVDRFVAVHMRQGLQNHLHEGFDICFAEIDTSVPDDIFQAPLHVLKHQHKTAFGTEGVQKVNYKRRCKGSQGLELPQH